MTMTFNQTLVLTYNMAFIGAAIDFAAIDSINDNDLVHQVDAWQGMYEKQQHANWTAENTLFIFEFAINDIINSYKHTDNYRGIAKEFLSYKQQIRRLYDMGARNFIVTTSPPIDLAPMYTDPFFKKHNENTNNRITQIAKSVQNFNSHFQPLATAIYAEFPADDVPAFWVYDLHSLFTDLTIHPHLPTQWGLKPISRTKNCCYHYWSTGRKGYPRIFNETGYFREECEVPADEWLWLNDLHPQWPVHEIVAREIVGGERMWPGGWDVG
ncbi:MAG: hypothetical protein Q9190_007409 [Brigantiaea leucoxantha]